MTKFSKAYQNFHFSLKMLKFSKYSEVVVEYKIKGKNPQQCESLAYIIEHNNQRL